MGKASRTKRESRTKTGRKGLTRKQIKELQKHATETRWAKSGKAG